jgi:hypothetical protein
LVKKDNLEMVEVLISFEFLEIAAIPISSLRSAAAEIQTLSEEVSVLNTQIVSKMNNFQRNSVNFEKKF